jgi:hypothetical protein
MDAVTFYTVMTVGVGIALWAMGFSAGLKR